MSWLFGHLRKTTTGLAAGVWLFALFVGIAHACGSVEPSIAPVHAVAANASQHSPDEGAPVGCGQFCKCAVPVVARLPLVGGPPDARPLINTVNYVRVVLAYPLDFPLAVAAHSSSDVASFLRFTRLRL